eukprot:g8265.t1
MVYFEFRLSFFAYFNQFLAVDFDTGISTSTKFLICTIAIAEVEEMQDLMQTKELFFSNLVYHHEVAEPNKQNARWISDPRFRGNPRKRNFRPRNQMLGAVGMVVEAEEEAAVCHTNRTSTITTTTTHASLSRDSVISRPRITDRPER